MKIYIGGAEPTQHADIAEAEAVIRDFCLNEIGNTKIRVMDSRSRLYGLTVTVALTPSNQHDLEGLREFTEHFETRGFEEEHDLLCDIWRHLKSEDVLVDLDVALSTDLYDRLQRLMEAE